VRSISSEKVKSYIEGIKPNLRDAVLKAIIEGEGLSEVLQTEQGAIFMQILNDKLFREMDSMLGLVRSRKYETDDELRQIQKICIGINKLVELIVDIGSKLTALDRAITSK
jgi:hypothetical protein